MGRHATKEALRTVPRARRSAPGRRQLVALASLIAVAFGGFAAVTLSQSAGTPPVRCAFSYNWFPEAWRQQGLNPFTHDHPTAGFYDSSDATKAKADVAALQGAKVDCSIDSWWGQGTRTDEREAGLLAAADGTGFKRTIYYEPEGTRNPSPAQIGADLAYLATYAKDPNWLTQGGKPVIFVYGDGSDGCDMVDRWASAPNRSSWYVVLKVFAGYRSCANQPDDWHQYGPAERTDQQGSHSFTISPGFWKANEATPRLPRDLTAWKTAIQEMVASGAHWQLISTWNEWGEGTAIESATEWGASYLDALADDGSTTTTAGPPESVNVTFAPAADATISMDSPTSNRGSSSRIVADGSPVQDFLLRFDVNTGGCAITHAALSITVDSRRNSGSRSGGVFHISDTSWTESDVNWTNAPLPGVVVATLGDVAAGTTYDVDLSSVVTVDGPVGLRVTNPSADGAFYVSRQGSQDEAPRLVVTCGTTATSSTQPPTTTAPPPTTSSTTTTTTTTPTTTTAAPPPATGVCGGAGAVPAQYQSVVVFAFENRTWADVGGPGFGDAMPYLRDLGRSCSYFSSLTETAPTQNSLTQYIGQVTGAFQPGTVNDCSPSAACSTIADNIFRQARGAGKTAINYVEGATTGCSGSGNADKHIPTLYLWGADDRVACVANTRPYGEFDPNHLPNFAFVTPTLCNDGHDCSNATVDAWARANVQPVLNSAAYQAGQVAVFIWYDEDAPDPNLQIAPTAAHGPFAPAVTYASTLRAWESMLGLPCLANACSAVDMRALGHF